MNILDQIVAAKKKEVASRKSAVPLARLEQSAHFSVPALSMRQYIQRADKTGIIAEFKRKSPSKGIINDRAPVADTTTAYAAAGASALSVLTDTPFFGGTNDDLTAARLANQLPIIRKDFTIDAYQVVEAKSIGADAILLIAAVLEPKQSESLVRVAHSLGMEVLLEVHDEEELLRNLQVGADMIGVNNRNLKTFDVSMAVSQRLAPLIPPGVVKVSESGISSADTVLALREAGYEGFLMGENFMKHAQPGNAAKDFMDALRKAGQGRGSLTT